MRQNRLQAAIAVVGSLAIGAAACPDVAPAPPQNQPPVAVAGGYYAGQDTIHFDGRSRSHIPRSVLTHSVAMVRPIRSIKIPKP